MNLITKIAWRNIMRHRGKSLVIGAILFFGALLMTVGNGVISGMNKGLEEHIVSGFTGDIVLVADKQQSDNVFIEMMGKSIEPVYNFKQIDSVLSKLDYIDKYLPVGKNAAMVLSSTSDGMGFTYMIGIDFERYRKVFPDNMHAIEGRLLNKGERGVLVPTGARKEMYDATSVWYITENGSLDTSTLTPEAKLAKSSLLLEDSVVLMGMNTDNSSTDIRLGIKGIIKYNALNTIWGHFGLMDIESYRECIGYITASDASVKISKKEESLLSLEGDNLDNLFSDNTSGSILDSESNDESADEAVETAAEPAVSEVDLDAGAYNMVLVFLKDHASLDKTVKRLNDDLKAKNLGVRAVSWKKATGTIGSMAVLIKGSLFIFVMFLFFVAIIIIVNTLSMAAIERTSEIGMMRAIGARKSFISSMFFGETAILAFFFGGLGIVTGFVVVNVLSMMHFTTNNDMVQLLYGGDTFSPFLSVTDIALAVIQLSIVTLIAVVYPMRLAQNITPLDAISRE